MSFHVLRISYLLVFWAFSFPSSGKLFRSPYVMFEIEDSWTCKAFGVNWICHHYLSSQAPPAFIFTTARLSSDSERLDFGRFEKKESSFSLISPAKKVSINKHVWIDSFHRGIFYKNVLSRYQRTICCGDLPEKFQVLVGFHAFEENYPKYASAFLKVIKSLNLLTDDLEEIRKLLKQQTAQQRRDMQNYIQGILFEADSESISTEKEQGLPRLMLLALGLFLLSVVWLAFYIKRQRKPVSKSSKKK